MSRFVSPGLLLLLLAVTACLAATDEEEDRIRQLRRRLLAPVTIDGFEPNTPLKEALGFLAERYDLPLFINVKAFATDENKEVEIATSPIRSPRLVGVPLQTVLRLILRQADADFIVKDGMLEIVPKDKADMKVLMRHPVHADFKKRPLAEALQSFCDHSGANIVLDPKIGDKGLAPITLRLHQVPVETAVRLAADLVDLKLVVMDNVLYVTTRENARELQADLEKTILPKVRDKEKKQQEPPQPGRPEKVPAPKPEKESP